jgi:hypothetical protein
MVDSPERDIADLLHRRNDLSTFLVHLTRSQGGVPARENLLTILVECMLRAATPMGMLVSKANVPQTVKDTQRVVCFTETPLEHVWMLVENIKHRAVKLEPYGVAFTKSWARRSGINPVWYIDITIGHEWLINPLNALIDRVAAGQSCKWVPNDSPDAAGQWVVDTLEAYPLTTITPFIEQMGKPAQVVKEFWWEREWRHVGNLGFQWWHSAVAIFVPEADHAQFRVDLVNKAMEEWPPQDPPSIPRLLDPRWGLERMIASLAGVADEDAGPFPA